MRIAIDVMGGDSGVDTRVRAAIRCINEIADLQLSLVGDQAQIEHPMSSLSFDSGKVDVCHTDEIVAMDDRPSVALRRKRNSSMYMAITKVKDGAADACVSSGNTGALMAIGRHLLKTMPGIDRPAIIKAMPSLKGRCYVLDLGANIDCDAENLIQFAAMGSLMCGAVENIESPSIGLLNIGEELIKGGDQVKIAAALLRDNSLLNFIGFVEGDAISQSGADVIVCDRWVGNVALKTSEGLAKFVATLIQEAFDQNLATRAAGVIANRVLDRLRERLRPEQYNGATLLGLRGIVVKSHGQTSEDGFVQAIKEAIKEADQNVPNLIHSELDAILSAYP